MTPLEGLLIFIVILAIYGVAVYWAHRSGFLKKHHISFMGPALMWRTTRGVAFLKRIAKKKHWWQAYASTGILLCIIMMIFMTSLLIWQAWVISGFNEVEQQALPGPEFSLFLPVINPILPLEYLGYILIGIIVAIVIHEFSHGIVTSAHNFKVKSLGILYMIIPIGAFVEPDEEKVKKASIKPRMRIYAAGPTANFVMVIITMLLFIGCMTAVQPAAEGMSVLVIGNNTPAANSSLQPGAIITEIDQTPIKNETIFLTVLEQTTAGQSLTLQYVQADQTVSEEIILANRATFTKNQSDQGKGYLGVSVVNAHEGFLQILKNPFIASYESFLLFYALPLWGYFQGYNPIVAPYTNSYVITGVLGFIPDPVFWVFVNAIYWIFWLNLAVALFNVLPMVPLDGGFLFNDSIRSLVSRIKKGISEEHRDQIVKNISIVLSFLILFLIIFPWIVKYI